MSSWINDLQCTDIQRDLYNLIMRGGLTLETLTQHFAVPHRDVASCFAGNPESWAKLVAMALGLFGLQHLPEMAKMIGFLVDLGPKCNTNPAATTVITDVAAKSADLATLEMLEAKGYDFSIPLKIQGVSILSCAAKRPFPVYQWLFQRVGETERLRTDSSTGVNLALNFAVTFGCPLKVELILKSLPQLKTDGPSFLIDYSLLDLAARWGHLEVLKLLLDHLPDASKAEAKVSAGETALHWGQTKVVEWVSA